jgi:hypothetical protein
LGGNILGGVFGPGIPGPGAPGVGGAPQGQQPMGFFQRVGKIVDQVNQQNIDNLKSDVDAGKQAVQDLDQAAGRFAPLLKWTPAGQTVRGATFIGGAQGNAMERGFRAVGDFLGF